MDKTYEAVIAKIKEHVAYLDTHRRGHYTTEGGHTNIWPEAMAEGGFQCLKEILDLFDEPHQWHKAHCGEGLCCMSDCNKSQLRIKQHKNIAIYECQCGHTWEDDEYPIATHFMCPQCYRGNDPEEEMTRLVNVWHATNTNKSIAEFLYLTEEEYAQFVETKLSASDTLMIRNKRKYERTA